MVQKPADVLNRFTGIPPKLGGCVPKDMHSTLLFVFATVSLIFPGTVSAANTPIYPTSIDGLPVVLVEDSTNTVSMPAGDVILCLYDKTSPTLEDSLANLNSSSDSVDNPLPKGWSIEVFGGPGSSIQKFVVAYYR